MSVLYVHTPLRPLSFSVGGASSPRQIVFCMYMYGVNVTFDSFFTVNYPSHKKCGPSQKATDFL